MFCFNNTTTFILQMYEKSYIKVIDYGKKSILSKKLLEF